MEEEEEKIIMSDKLKEQLGIESNSEVLIRKEENNLVISNSYKTNGNLPIKYFLYPTIIATIIFLITIFFFDDRSQIPLNGEYSLSSMVLSIGGLVGGITFIIFLFYIKINKKGTLSLIYWRDFPAIIISILVMIIILFIWIFWVLDILFHGVSFDIFTSTVLFFLFAAALNYLLIYITSIFNSKIMTRLFIFFIIAGTFYAMINNKNEYWWRVNFSYLGTSNAIDSWQFNLTLILTALLMIAMIDYIFTLIKKKFKENYKQFIPIKVLLLIMAIVLGGIGLVPNDDGIMHTIHDGIANSLVVVLAVTIIFIKWLLPYHSKDFVWLSYGIGITLVVMYALFSIVNYLSLTAFELIAFILIFVWLLRLIQQLEALTNDDPEYVKVIIE